jgi:hypothetical protein
MVMLTGVQSNQFPRALGIARVLMDAGILLAVLTKMAFVLIGKS